jgi:hypothetical protein
MTTISRLIAAVAALATVIGISMAATATPVSAQTYTGRIVCEARSPSAFGYGVNHNGAAACQRALNECSVRTPSYQVCYVTRSYYEVY